MNTKSVTILLVTVAALSVWAQPCEGQFFRRRPAYSSQAYSNYNGYGYYQNPYSYGAQRPSCTCPSNAMPASQRVAATTNSPYIQYEAVFDPRTNRIYMRPKMVAGSNRSNQATQTKPTQFDVARKPVAGSETDTQNFKPIVPATPVPTVGSVITPELAAPNSASLIQSSVPAAVPQQAIQQATAVSKPVTPASSTEAKNGSSSFSVLERD